jgi:hypothetical protein
VRGRRWPPGAGPKDIGWQDAGLHVVTGTEGGHDGAAAGPVRPATGDALLTRGLWQYARYYGPVTSAP